MGSYDVGAGEELRAHCLLHFHFISRKTKVQKIYMFKHLFTENTLMYTLRYPSMYIFLLHSFYQKKMIGTGFFLS